MHCDEVRIILLDYGWNADERRRATLLLRHLEGCDACRAAVADYDVLRAALHSAGAGAAADAAEPSRGWHAFLERMVPARADHGLRLRPRPSGGRAVALAACVVFSLVAFQLGRKSAPPPVALVPALPAPSTSSTNTGGGDARRAEDTFLASLSPSTADAARQATAFDQLSDIFDRKASWLMTSSGGASDVGLAPDAVPAGHRLLMVRLTLLHGGAVASNADVVIVPGQSADLSLPMADGRSLKYHVGTSAGEPTELTLWLEVQAARGAGGRETLAALATNLRVRPGERVAAGELATTSGKYELKVGFTQAQSAPPPPPSPIRPPARAKGGIP